MGGVTSYLYPTEENEIPIDKNEHLSYVIERDIRFIKSTEDEFYTIYEKGNFLTEKKIPQGSYFTITKFQKTKTGNIRILAQFDQELELIDMTAVFSGINPLIPRVGWIRDALSTSLFLSSKACPVNVLRNDAMRRYSNSY